MKKLMTICLVMVTGLALAGQGKNPKSDEWFTNADTDKDGKLSLAEFSAAFTDKANAEAKFKEADTDQDGQLTLKEWQDFHQAHRKAKAKKAK